MLWCGFWVWRGLFKFRLLQIKCVRVCDLYMYIYIYNCNVVKTSKFITSNHTIFKIHSDWKRWPNTFNDLAKTIQTPLLGMSNPTYICSIWFTKKSGKICFFCQSNARWECLLKGKRRHNAFLLLNCLICRVLRCLNFINIFS